MQRARSNPVSRWLGLGLLLTCAIGVVGGCSPTPAPAAPGERGAPLGLEAMWWVVDDSNNDRVYFEALGQALLPYVQRPIGIPDEQLRLWRANGLRVVAVPVGDLELLHDRLRCVGQAREQWLGVVPTWTSVAAGISFDRAWTLRLDNGPIELQAGQVRLLCRAWFVPIEPSLDRADAPMGAGLTIDLLPQHAETSRETLSQAYGLDPRPQATESGVTFERLLLHLTADGQDALVIVPEDPTVDWKPLPPGTPRVLPTQTSGKSEDGIPSGPDTAPAATKTDSGDVQKAAAMPTPTEPSMNGPQPFHVPTLGEAMLADVDGLGLSRRLVVVLVPRVPERFELIPR